MQLTWLFLFVADRRKGKTVIPVPSIEFSTAKGNLEREQEVEETMVVLLQSVTE